MTYLEAIKNRYTTKLYDPAQHVSESMIQDLQEVLRLCPSSINSQPWKFIFVTSRAMKEKLAPVSLMNDQKVQDCSALIVCCGVADVDKFDRDLQVRLSEDAFQYYHDKIKVHGEDYVRHWCAKQVYLAAGVLLGACADMKIDSTPIEGINAQAYDEILQPEGLTTLMAVAVGVRDPEDPNQPAKAPKIRKDLSEVVEVV